MDYFVDLPDARENLALERIIGHRSRQRERSRNGGWEEFRNREILEVLLNYVVPRQDMSDLAFRLDNRFGGVMQALTAPKEALMEIPGMTAAMAEWFALTGDLVRAYQRMQYQNGIRLMRFIEVRDFLLPRLGWARPPEAWILYTDFEFRLLCRQPLPLRNPWWSQVNVRHMVQDGSSLEASYAILVLFRGAGMPPRLSEQEQARLTGINQTFEAMQMPLIDCVLVGGGDIYSMHLHGRFAFLRQSVKKGYLFERYGEE